MQNAGVLVACLVLGVGGGVLGARFGGSGAPESAAPPAAAPSAAVPDSLVRRLDRLEESVAALGRRSAEPAPAVPAPAAAGAGEGASPQPEDRVAALEARIAVLEKGGPIAPPDLPKKSIEELQAMAREVSGGGKEPGKALRIYEELLKRDLPDDVRRAAAFQLGYGYRALKDHAKEEAVFRDLLRTTDPATPDGANAVFQLSWSRFYQNDLQESGALMEKLSEMPSADTSFQAHAIFRVGQFAHMAKDEGRARAYLERLLKERLADVPASGAWILDEAKRILKEMDGR